MFFLAYLGHGINIDYSRKHELEMLYFHLKELKQRFFYFRLKELKHLSVILILK